MAASQWNPRQLPWQHLSCSRELAKYLEAEHGVGPAIAQCRGMSTRHPWLPDTETMSVPPLSPSGELPAEKAHRAGSWGRGVEALACACPRRHKCFTTPSLRPREQKQCVDLGVPSLPAGWGSLLTPPHPTHPYRGPQSRPSGAHKGLRLCLRRECKRQGGTLRNTAPRLVPYLATLVTRMVPRTPVLRKPQDQPAPTPT